MWNPPKCNINHRTAAWGIPLEWNDTPSIWNVLRMDSTDAPGEDAADGLKPAEKVKSSTDDPIF